MKGTLSKYAISAIVVLAAAQLVPHAFAQMEEVLVTAQRREERAVDVPISIATLGSDQIAQAGIQTTNEIAILLPGVRMERIGIYTQPSIRGITTVITGPGADANVAMYLDGVYQQSNATNNFELPDVERIEVLKGPQGTLFGRNATGGAIQVFTKSPSYEPTGSFTASYGNYDHFRVKGFVSGPIVPDKVAASLAASYSNREDYVENIAPGPLKGKIDLESYLVRGKLLFDLTENLQIVLTGRYSEHEDSLLQYALNGNSLGKLFDPNTIVPIDVRDVALNLTDPNTVKSYDFTARIEWDTSYGRLTSITAYVDGLTTSRSDADGSFQPNGAGLNFYVNQDDEYFSQELSFASELEGAWNFVVGVYYTDGDSRWDPLGIEVAGAPSSIFALQETESVAGFGELYVDVTDRLSLIAGVRYSWEERKHESDVPTGAVDLPRPESLTPRGKESWDDLTPRLSIRYALSDRGNIYFTYSEGFKSGVFNTSSTAFNDFADPEEIKGYEIGYKGNPKDTVALNAAVFYYDYKDIQQTAFVVNDTGLPLARVSNAASAEILGAEIDANILLTPELDLRLAMTYLDHEFKDFPNAVVNVPNLLDPNDPRSGAGNIGTPFDASGQPLVRAPDFSVSVTPQWTTMIMGGEFILNGTFFYQTKTSVTFDERITVKSHAKLNLRASWSPADSGITFALYGQNLTDKDVLSGAFPNQFADASTFEPPRTFGGSIRYDF